jgi:hypothetical protein
MIEISRKNKKKNKKTASLDLYNNHASEPCDPGRRSDSSNKLNSTLFVNTAIEALPIHAHCNIYI